MSPSNDPTIQQTSDKPSADPAINVSPKPNSLSKKEIDNVLPDKAGGEDAVIEEKAAGKFAQAPSLQSTQKSDLPLRQLEQTPTLSSDVHPKDKEENNMAEQSKEQSLSPNPPPQPPPKDEKFKPELEINTGVDPEKEAYKQEDAEKEEAKIVEKSGDEQNEYDGTGSEIQSIMEQFDEGMGGPGAEEIMSPRLEIAGPMLGSPIAHPPRRSSLEPPRSSTHSLLHPESSSSQSTNAPPPPRSSSLVSLTPSGLGIIDPNEKELPKAPSSPLSARQHAPLPPRPDPESDLPFDFHRFLEQLRHRSADPVAKFLRSFLNEFGKKQWMVHEQVKIVSDFLDFITKKMAQCDVWRTVSDAEFDNACEGMEKLVMNRLYSQTFSPAIPPPDLVSGRAKRRSTVPLSGRRGQHQEDVERDDVLAQKVRIYSWVREEHLDIKAVSDKGRKFLSLAQQELLKIGNYRAPRDKVICVLNCCKVIFGFLKNAEHDQSADSFIPLLIYTVLRANPPNLVSNVQYILRFRNANKLTGEAGYYVSSLGGAIDFIERLDRTSLTISDEEFEKNVEASVSQIAEGHPPDSQEFHTPGVYLTAESERTNLDLPPPLPRRSKSPRSGNESDEEHAAVAGLLRTIQKPLSTIGRIFSDDSSPAPIQQHQPPATPQPVRGLSPLQLGQPMDSSSGPPPTPTLVSKMSAEDSAARQASKEAEEARKIRMSQESHDVDTLCVMFPALEREVVIDVVRANEGRIGSAVDACLALSG